ncbi:MAG: radical SAM family heme chaperone HemW [Bacteroidales bacterium]
MAGIYIHVPFCQTRCLYCDFFSNTRMDKKEGWLNSLCKEISLRKDYLKGETIRTLYFGGGTPSQLDKTDFERIFHTLSTHFDLSLCEEITLEGNPEDLTTEYIAMLRSFPFNRISMGVQSFDDNDLKFLNRRHNAGRAEEAVKSCQRAGFNNISIDLIYGLPGQTIDGWKKNLEKALSLDVQHISSYHLIYEEDTALYRLQQQGKVSPVNEETSLEMFRILIDTLQTAGFEHYEISNFARNGLYSKHNSSYWKGVPYLGLGPGSHSYDGKNRHFNPGNLNLYIEGVENDINNFIKTEILSADEQYNEFILISLRTMWGLSLEDVRLRFGEERYRYCLEMAKPYLEDNLLKEEAGILKLSKEGIFISDGIMSDLLYVE